MTRTEWWAWSAAILVSVVLTAVVLRYGRDIDAAAVDCAEDCERAGAWARAIDPCECAPYETER